MGLLKGRCLNRTSAPHYSSMLFCRSSHGRSFSSRLSVSGRSYQPQIAAVFPVQTGTVNSITNSIQAYVKGRGKALFIGRVYGISQLSPHALEGEAAQ